MRLIIISHSPGCWEDKCDNVWKFFIACKLLYPYKTQLIITTYLTLRESWSTLVWFQAEILQYWSLQCFGNPEVAVANGFFCLATINFTFLASLLQEEVTLGTSLFCPQGWQAIISVWNLIRRCGLGAPLGGISKMWFEVQLTQETLLTSLKWTVSFELLGWSRPLHATWICLKKKKSFEHVR